jgi:hypothetical protein
VGVLDHLAEIPLVVQLVVALLACLALLALMENTDVGK